MKELNIFNYHFSYYKRGFFMSEINDLISTLETFPTKLNDTVTNLSQDKLQTKIINWTIQQAVHHICDSHINSYIRIKLALTEFNPTICPYDETTWSNLADIHAPIIISLSILQGIHERICLVLKSISESDWQRTLVHPERTPAQITLLEYVHSFADHGEHHLKSISETLKNV